jgi:hypothetical protein
MTELTHDQIVELSKHPFRCAECRQWFDDGEPESLCEKCERVESLETIRAFVGRVNERYLAWGDRGAYGDCVRDELVAMETEVKE